MKKVIMLAALLGLAFIPKAHADDDPTTNKFVMLCHTYTEGMKFSVKSYLDSVHEPCPVIAFICPIGTTTDDVVGKVWVACQQSDDLKSKKVSSFFLTIKMKEIIVDKKYIF